MAGMLSVLASLSQRLANGPFMNGLLATAWWMGKGVPHRAMSGAQSISIRRAYGVQRVCRVWHRARSSVYARRQATRSPARCRRRGPIGAAPDDVLVRCV